MLQCVCNKPGCIGPRPGLRFSGSELGNLLPSTVTFPALRLLPALCRAGQSNDNGYFLGCGPRHRMYNNREAVVRNWIAYPLSTRNRWDLIRIARLSVTKFCAVGQQPGSGRIGEAPRIFFTLRRYPARFASILYLSATAFHSC